MGENRDRGEETELDRASLADDDDDHSNDGTDRMKERTEYGKGSDTRRKRSKRLAS
jgi:hypothetical protein